jgi:hypothetical protein
VFNSNGVKSPTILRKVPFCEERGVLVNYFEVASCSHPPVWTSAVCIERALLQEIGGFPVGIKSGEDLLTWARVAVRTDWAYSMREMAQYNVEGYYVNERPRRVPAEIDVVGAELKKMWQESSKASGMRRYVANWHKMRSSVYMRLGEKKNSIKEAMISLRYYPLNFKVYAYILLNVLNIYNRG